MTLGKCLHSLICNMRIMIVPLLRGRIMKHKIGGACIVLRTVPNIYPLNKSQLSLLAFKFLDKYWQVSLHKCYQSVLPSVWEWPPLYILNTVNYFLIFANMSMTYHNSLICISLIKHEVKDTSICLSAFYFLCPECSTDSCHWPFSY